MMMNTNERPYTYSRSVFNDMDSAAIKQIFDLDSLREKLYDRKEKAREGGWEKMRQILINTSSAERAEMLFAEKLLTTYGTSMPQIRYLLSSTPPELYQEEITQERKNLIDSMGGTMIGKHWIRCMKQPDGWTYTARRIWDEKSQFSSSEIDNFFIALDEISILTDLLEGRGDVYGISISLKPEKKAAASDFDDLCLYKEKGYILTSKLQELISGKTSKRLIVMPIRAAMDAGVLSRPTYEQFLAAFNLDPKVVSKSSYNNYTNTEHYKYFGDDFEAVKGIVREALGLPK